MLSTIPFPLVNLNVEKTIRNGTDNPRKNPNIMCFPIIIRNLCSPHISVWHLAKPHSYQVLKLKQQLLPEVDHKFLCWNPRCTYSEGQGVLWSFSTFWELESTSVSLWPCSSHLQGNCQLKKVIHTLLPQNDLAPVITIRLVLVCINLLPLRHIWKIMFSIFHFANIVNLRSLFLYFSIYMCNFCSWVLVC